MHGRTDILSPIGAKNGNYLFIICFQCCSLLFPHVCRGGQQGRGQDGGRGEVQGEFGFEEH